MTNQNKKYRGFGDIPTPTYVVDEKLLKNNLEILKSVIDRTGCHILLAQKCFSMYSLYPLIGEYLSGTTASGLYEAKLGREEMGNRQVHVYSAAFRDDEIDEILSVSDHIVFNSINQWNRFKDKAQKAGVSCGIRINPECSTQEGHAIYDPCAPNSRMGVTLENFEGHDFEGLDGIHFHTLCEQNSDDLVKTVNVVEQKFGKYLYDLKWLNLGGGHHITREDYDIEKLINIVNHLKETYKVEVYLEPGEAVALNAGFLVSTVLDTIKNGMNIAIMDSSAACHMPDVLEVPYTPQIIGAKVLQENYESDYIYRLGGPTCLAGDIIGNYVFDHEIKVGERLVFCDMAIYSMVKNNTFNGMRLPSIAIKRADNTIDIIKEFGYEDFKARLS